MSNSGKVSSGVVGWRVQPSPNAETSVTMEYESPSLGRGKAGRGEDDVAQFSKNLELYLGKGKVLRAVLLRQFVHKAFFVRKFVDETI